MNERKLVLTFNDGTTKEIPLTDAHFDCGTRTENRLDGNRLSISRVFWWPDISFSNMQSVFEEMKSKSVSIVSYLVDGVVIEEKSGISGRVYSVGDLLTNTGLRKGYGAESISFTFI